MSDAHGGVGLVHMLTPRSGGTIGLYPQIFFIYLHLHLFVHDRRHVQRGKGRVPPIRRINRRDTNQSVNATFSREKTVSDFSSARESSALHSSLFPLSRLIDLHFKIPALSPAHIHASVSYTHLRAHETKANLVCRLLLEK